MQAHHLTLDQIEGMTVAFLDLAESMARPLLKRERRAFRFLLTAWEQLRIRNALKSMPKAKLGYYTDLMIQLRELIDPDPTKRLRLKRAKPETVAELNAGNFSVKAPPIRGVSIRRMSAAEATERVQLMTKMADGMAQLARELALVRNRDRPEADRMAKLGRHMAKLGRAFAARPTAIPAERSMEEIMDDMQKLAELMEAPA